MNKIISCIGDSLTEGDYGVFGKRGISDVRKENYPYFLEKISHQKVHNFGHCGFRSSDMLRLLEEGYNDLTGSDVIVILLGTNGGQTGEGNSQEDKAYRSVIDFCRKKAPDATIYLATPPNVTTNPHYSNCGYYPRVKEARRFVRKVAGEYNLPLIELDKCPLLVPENESIMQPNDGLHFSEKGYQVIAETVYEAIRRSLD